jgi:hypothetical protein
MKKPALESMTDRGGAGIDRARSFMSASTRVPWLPPMSGAMALLAASCSSKQLPPPENFERWKCTANIFEGPEDLTPHQPWFDNICVDPGSSSADATAKCQQLCDKVWNGNLSGPDQPIPVQCHLVTDPVQDLMTKCDGTEVNYQTDPPTPCNCVQESQSQSQEQVAIDPSSTVVVDVGGQTSPVLYPTGTLGYTIEPCGASVCPFRLANLDLATPDFSIQGQNFTGIAIHSAFTGIDGRGMPGTIQSGSFTFAPTQVRIGADLAINQTPATITVTNALLPVVGTADPASNTFVISGTFNGPAADTTPVTVTINLTGHHTNLPPVAVAAPTGTLECNAPQGSNVVLDGTASQDPQNDIQSYTWSVSGTAIGSGATLPTFLPLGAIHVRLVVVDGQLALGIADNTVTVADTTPPAFPPLSTVVDTLCDTSTQLATLPVPVTTDVCSPTPPLATGAITSINGNILSVPVSLQQNGPTASVLVGPGTYGVTWTATDPSGNVGSATQTLVVRAAIQATDAVTIDDRALVAVPGGGFAQLGNAGKGLVNLGVNAQTGSVFTQGNVLLRNFSIVHGSVLAAGTITEQSGASVTGATSGNATVVLPAGMDLSGIVFPKTNAGPVDLEPGVVRTLAPGAYGDVAVKSNAKLTLSSGTYFVTSLDLEPMSKLNLNQSSGPVLLYVQKSIIDRGQIASFSGPPGGFVLGYAGTSTFFVEARFLAGTVIAPNASVVITSLGAHAFRGLLFAKDIEVQPDATLTCDPIGESGSQEGLTPNAFQPSFETPAAPSAAPTREARGGCSAGASAPLGSAVPALGCLLGLVVAIRRSRRRSPFGRDA